jgi:hypothetical protein
MGWPSEIAPPLTFTRSIFQVRFLGDGEGLSGKGFVRLDEIHGRQIHTQSGFAHSVDCQRGFRRQGRRQGVPAERCSGRDRR